MKLIKDETGIIPFEEYSTAFRMLDNAVTMGLRRESDDMHSTVAGLIWRVAFPLFREKIYQMSSLETSLVVKAYDCFAPLERHFYEYACLHRLGILTELQGLTGGPEIIIREVKTRKNLSFRFSISDRIHRRYKIR